ncbi:GreA/GreB family elongation factor [Novosphingobium rosa]|uniref:GreA/GreB family elongation factor n=1 Tax=Novosphingobium rosa TaxID=76978 RepID=UPI00083476F3|nr:GreA/GreB family elongation factor [Novosphingobium rosa]
MSVAFRRDGDDEHLEPKFEIPIPPGPNLVTPRGLALIGKKLAALEVELAKGGEEAQINALKRELRYWTTRQITAELVPAPDGSVVAIGTRVGFILNGKRRDLSIVGDDEADPTQGSIAFSAPLARALIGGEEGEFLPFSGKDDAIEVLEIAVI